MIVDRVMQRAALATGQFMPPGTFSHIDNHPVAAADAEAARRLLTEAGYPQGFQITLAGSNDRYMNDSRVVQAVGQMWTRIGIRTTVEAQPYATFIGRATRREVPAALLTWGNSTGDSSVLLNSVLRTRDRDRGHGAANRTNYSNAELDRLTGEAEREMDDAKRDQLLQQASLVAINDVALVPLYLQNALWAMSGTTLRQCAVPRGKAPPTRRRHGFAKGAIPFRQGMADAVAQVAVQISLRQRRPHVPTQWCPSAVAYPREPRREGAPGADGSGLAEVCVPLSWPRHRQRRFVSGKCRLDRAGCTPGGTAGAPLCDLHCRSAALRGARWRAL
jgi:hypothetical protein